MSNRNSVIPKNKLRLKRLFLFTVSAGILAAIIWKVFLVSTTTLISTQQAKAQFTPATGPLVSGYSWEQTILIDYTQVMENVDLVDFPLLVSVTNSDLKHTSLGGFVESDFGYDILFCGENNARLSHQIESYDPATGTLVAWVNLPLLYCAIDTELKITCGNASITTDQTSAATWNSSFEAVWHMDNDPSTSDLEDVAGTYDASPHGSMTSSDVVTGQIGDAIEFDGTNDYFAIQDKFYTNAGEIQQITVSSWVYTNYSNGSWTSNWAILDFDRSEYFNFFVHGNGKLSFSTRQAGSGIHDFHGGQTGQVNNGQWHHVAATYEGTEKRVFIDGVLVNTTITTGNGLGTGATRYGFIGEGSEASYYNGGRNGIYFQGKIDELRLYNIALSPGRIATEFNNQSSPNTFMTFGNTNANLPIELGYFAAKLKEDQVYVDWTTISQRDNDYFDVERSEDGTSFESIGQIKGAGTSTQTLHYDFLDPSPLQGLSYYRLRQTDFNGATETFNLVAIQYILAIDKVTIENVWPNPFKDEFNVKFTSSAETEVTVALLNSNGMQVFSDQVQTQGGENEYKFYSNSDLTPGLYFLNIIQDGEVKATSKVMKQ